MTKGRAEEDPLGEEARYVGIVESILIRLAVGKNDPRANQKRSIIHWAVVIATVAAFLVAVGIVAAMVLGLLRG
ncbi:hypothetical protein ACPPVW_06440 [Leifsonia sp. McL0607]|uniref:hypothetical protein n=1 Tax=Leifsonia sp. McL0607 TaxID=3415672 RepID=UPI003CF45E79